MTIHCNLICRSPKFSDSPVSSLRAGRLVRQAIDVSDALAIQHAQGQGGQESGTIPATRPCSQGGRYPWDINFMVSEPVPRIWACVPLATKNGVLEWWMILYEISTLRIIWTYLNRKHPIKPIYFRGWTTFPVGSTRIQLVDPLIAHVRLIRLIKVAKSIKPGFEKSLDPRVYAEIVSTNVRVFALFNSLAGDYGAVHSNYSSWNWMTLNASMYRSLVPKVTPCPTALSFRPGKNAMKLIFGELAVSAHRILSFQMTGWWMQCSPYEYSYILYIYIYK